MQIDDPPLQGVRVLDLASGPLAAIGRLLGELGAGRGAHRAGRDRCRTWLEFVAGNLGKRVIACDLNKPADKAVFESLLPTADILIQSAVPDSADA